MIQDIEPHIFHNEYQTRAPKDQDMVLIYKGRNVYLTPEKETFLTWEEYRKFPDAEEQPLYLFLLDETAYFLSRSIPKEVEKTIVKKDVEIFRTFEPMHLAFAGITGANLSKWYENNRFCGKCGNSMALDGTERALRCPKCDNLVYPVISPAVIVGVRNKNRLLLTKYSRGTYKKYALIAGFTEIGESMEQTVHREVMEEVGLRVKNLTYYKSQPWPFTGTELLGFFADLDGDDEIVLEQDELKEGTWFERDELPPTDGHISLTAEMMEVFRAGKDPK